MACFTLALVLVYYADESMVYLSTVYSTELAFKVYIIIISIPIIVGNFVENKLLMLIVGTYYFHIQNSAHRY